MTNEELYEDLKQFIEATVSQQAASKDDVRNMIQEVKGEIKDELKQLRNDIQVLDEKIDLVQDAIAESFTHTTETTNATLKDHEQRLMKLERQPA